MPSRASTYFFETWADMSYLGEESCQCPQRASTYFFNKPYNTGGKHNEVSMPSTGFYLFLLITEKEMRRRQMVSMPSTGFYLFLLQMREDISKQVSVSMPSTGFYLFLPDHAKATKQAAHGVNALNGLLLISSKTWQNLCVPLSCVNALNGLLLISSRRF